MTSRRLAWSCSWTPPMEFSRDGQTSVLPTAELQFKTPTHSQRAPEEGSTPCGLHWPSKTCPAVPPWSRSAAPRTATDACPSCRTVRSGNGQSLEPSVSLSAWMRYRSGNCESALHRAKSQRSVPGTWHFFFAPWKINQCAEPCISRLLGDPAAGTGCVGKGTAPSSTDTAASR